MLLINSQICFVTIIVSNTMFSNNNTLFFIRSHWAYYRICVYLANGKNTKVYEAEVDDAREGFELQQFERIVVKMKNIIH